MNFIFEVIGYIASVLLSFLLVPQVYTTYKTKKIDGLSSWFLYFEVVTTILWIIYGIGFLLDGNLYGLPIIIANASLFINVIILIVLKNKYQKQSSGIF